jgi:geranylgeranyl pyrophosphate synthase
MNQDKPRPFDEVRKSAKKLGLLADQMDHLLNKTKSDQGRIRDAAPVMLETLQWICSLKTGGLIEAKARAAIAEATGKQITPPSSSPNPPRSD